MGRKEVKMRRRMRRGTKMRDGEGTAEDFKGATNSATNTESKRFLRALSSQT